MILSDLTKINKKDKILLKCDNCKKNWYGIYKFYLYKKKHLCKSCLRIKIKNHYEIIKEYTANNLSCNKIAKKYKFNSETIRKLLIRNNIKLRKKNIYRTIEFNNKIGNKIIEDYKNNLTIKKLSLKYNYHIQTISNFLKNNNIEITIGRNNKIIFNNEEKEKIIKLYKNGFTVQDISEIYNISFGVINNFLRENNIKVIINKYSKISQKFFWNIYEKIKYDFKEIYFATLNQETKEPDWSGVNNEYFIITRKSKRWLDLYVKDINLCIEYQGNFYHKNNYKDLKRELEIKEVNPKIKILYIDGKKRFKNNEIDYIISSIIRKIYIV